MSETKFKPCPFCGSENIKDLGMIKGCGVSCINEECAAYMANVPVHKWNIRYYERENNQLRTDLKQLAVSLDVIVNTVIDRANNPDSPIPDWTHHFQSAQSALSLPSVQSALKYQPK